jgi:hypothetical protein
MVLLTITLVRAESYNMEQNFDSPTTLPQAVLSHIVSDVGNDLLCAEFTPEAVLEGRKIQLGPPMGKLDYWSNQSLCVRAVMLFALSGCSLLTKITHTRRSGKLMLPL